nr:FecR domain-containing protein [Asticcacaulis aquaticus]
MIEADAPLTLVTRRGEIRSIPLADGSAVSLNTDTSIRTKYSPQRREIWLDSGEVDFSILNDIARPFIVFVRGVEVVSSNARLLIQNLPGAPIKVLVSAGVAELRGRTAEQRVRLNANMGAIVPDVADAQTPAIRLVPLAPGQIEQASLWRVGKVGLEGQRLQDAVSEFRRYGDVKIVWSDPKIGQEEVSGMFDLRDPVGFARAVAESLDLKLSVSGDEIVLAYK